MYKVEIDISDWSWAENEKVTIETNDFEKAQIIQEFVEFQQEFGWAAEYDLTDEFIDAQCDEEVSEDEDSYDEDEIVEDEEFAEYEIGEIVEDEDGLLWKRVA
jgi:hypothetical protein